MEYFLKVFLTFKLAHIDSITHGNTRNKYVVSNQESHVHSVKYLNILKETVTNVEHAGNLVVVKTYAGMAQAAAAALDSMGWTEIIGSIAGDDTIMLVLRSADASRTFSVELSGLLSIN